MINPTTVQGGRYCLSSHVTALLREGTEFDLVRAEDSAGMFTIALRKGGACLPLAIGLDSVWVSADGVPRNQVEPQGLCSALLNALEPVTK